MKNELASNFVQSDDVFLSTVIRTPVRCTHTFRKGVFTMLRHSLAFPKVAARHSRQSYPTVAEIS